MKKLIIILFFILTSTAIAADTSPETILIINSYNEDYTWTNNIMNGILGQLDDVDVRIEYMDVKNFYSEEDIEAFHNLMVHKYKDYTLDAIITTDDAAFSYVMKERAFYDHTPVFFIGVNSKDNYPFDNYEKVYGIIEAVSVVDTINTAKTLLPSLKTIHVVVDSTPTGLATKQVITEVLDPHFDVVFYDNKTLDDIEFNLKRIQDNNAIVLLAYYIVDPRGIAFDTDIMSDRITAASSVPVFGLYNFSIEHGIVGGKLISGYDQGIRITELIAKYFQGQLGQRYIESNEANVYKFDYPIMKQFNFKENKLPESSIIINQPVSFFVKHRNVILASITIIIFLISYIIVLKHQVKYHTEKNILYNKKLSEADKLASLGEMMYRISHELNTPLGNSITTASYIAKTNSELTKQFNSGKLSKSMLLEKINNIEYSSELLLSSLSDANELMEAFRVFSEHNEEENVTNIDLNYYVKNLIRTYSPLLKSHQHTIVLDSRDSIIIKGKTKDYYKIFNHLIRNSIEHGFKDLNGRKITIELHQDKKQLVIVYSDNGRGISERDMAHIFKPLYSTKGKNHHGLGLSQIKDTIATLNGTIDFQSKLSQGVNIYISIPMILKKI